MDIKDMSMTDFLNSLVSELERNYAALDLITVNGYVNRGTLNNSMDSIKAMGVALQEKIKQVEEMKEDLEELKQ